MTTARSHADGPRRKPRARSRPGAAAALEVPTRWRGFELSEFQQHAIAAIQSGSNVLVGAPTGAGKTLVAEYAIEDAVRTRRRAIYTAPIKALSNQKYRDFRAAGLDVGLLTGDVTLHPTAQVLVMTTEILRNAIFDSPRELADVAYAVFDEIHFLDDQERGMVWEEALIFAPPSMRFICLSATVSNIRDLGAWIGEIRGRELVVVESHRRPVPLRHHVWLPGRGMVELERLSAARGRPPKPGKRGARDRRRGPPEGQELEALLDDLERRGELPVLCFAFSRKDCERLARRNQRRDLLSDAEHERMEALQRELIGQFQLEERELGTEVFSMARRGIGFHHAGMLPIDKEVVERMFTSGLIKMLFTTETFAVGINMPARTVVFHSLKKFDGVSVDWLRTREYMQMAGRAGRQGIDREGLVVSMVDPRDVASAPLMRILRGRPEPVVSRFRLSYSSLLHLVSLLGRERVLEAWLKSFDRFQHRAESQKHQDKQQRRQSAVVEARLQFLAELGYIEPDRETLTARGKTARAINGYEVQLTELAWRGALENLPPAALALVIVGLIYEERRRAPPEHISPRLHGPLRHQVTRLCASLAGLEATLGIAEPMKQPDWGLSEPIVLWCQGASLEELAEVTDVSPGDIVRTFRMAIQLMRQLRFAIDPAWPLHEALGRAMDLVNRDEVDARRQLELG